ncbi:F-box domain-containing protein [Mycena indigotica]|uniref:F-box domain-containing protein n=1 Tax=Mycena indigotica TaxID=2126181 RepID=A0A8H6S4B1_9AGAR|nr:F-box domain-containing protein [Mycena indigotica]KAF7292654.1 F-box domain-containing protein [Mycena indigotica]
MKLSSNVVALAVLSGGLANASPMRVIIASSNGNVAELHAVDVARLTKPVPVPIGRIGIPHAMPMPIVEGAVGAVAVPVPIQLTNVVPALTHGQQGKPCGRGGLRYQAGKMVAAVKIAFGFSIKSGGGEPTRPPPGTEFPPGLPPILEGPGHGHGPHHLLPVDAPVKVHVHHAQHKHAHHMHAHGHGVPESFLGRVHVALMSLGPWEGRAVAFVLGCGIGVLLRMFFVLSVLAVRAFRARAAPEAEYYTVLEIEDVDAEEIFVAPPMYTTPVPVAVVVDENGFPLEKTEESK